MASGDGAGGRRLLYTSPWFDRLQPYLGMLYSTADEHGYQVVGGDKYRDMSRPLDTVHFHYPNTISATRLISAINILFIIWCKLRGITVVYTVHNLDPHDPLGWRYRLLERFLLVFADTIVYHARFVGDRLTRMGLAGGGDRLVYIPHFSYRGFVPEDARVDIRARHSIPPDARVLLVFGMVRRYKGIDHILRAFAEVAGEREDVHLVILGRVFEPDHLAHLERELPTERVHFEQELVRDEDLASYFKEAWGTLYAQRIITTSGSAMMSTTFGVPMVYPDVAHFRDLGRAGVAFGPLEELPGAIRKLLELSEEEREAIRGHLLGLAEEWSYERVSRMFFRVLSGGGDGPS